MEKTMTKKELIEKYKTWYSGKRQQSRFEEDIKNLEKLPEDRNYSVVERQYTGHRYKPKKVNNLYPIVYISNAISWPTVGMTQTQKYGRNFVVI